MEALSKINCRQQPLHLSMHHHRSSFSRPISSISLLNPSSPWLSSSLRWPSIRASYPSSCSSSSSPTPKLQKLQNPFLDTLKPVLRTTCIAIAAAALFLARPAAHKPAFAATATVEPAEEESKEGTKPAEESKGGIAEEEKTLEEYLESNPKDVQALRSLMEVKIKSRKLDEAIGILDRLIEIEPEDREWPLMRAHTYIYNGDVELARLGFEEVLAKDPLQVEAYHGLVMAVSQSDSPEDLINVVKRVEDAMEKCKKEKKTEMVRDFKLLIAQVRVIEGNYDGALKLYQELVKEEPRDFRPYLCQGIIYTLLRKKDEAEKNFQKYRRLIPKEHPYAEYFDDNMFATKFFSQVADNQGAGSRS